MRVMASDLAAIRAEGRRLLADFYAFGTEDDGFRRDRLIDFFYDHADALLADPAPSVPLVEAGAALPKCPAYSPSVPEDHRVCSHGIYHHGCPSCDRQDPEERL